MAAGPCLSNSSLTEGPKDKPGKVVQVQQELEVNLGYIVSWTPTWAKRDCLKIKPPNQGLEK